MTRPLFSILLPSRNRHELLRHAVDSVLAQNFGEEAEIIISDNASEPSYAAYVASLGAIATRSVRSEAALPVTENWKRALAAATGRYVIMLGDDDALAPGWLARARGLIGQFDQPAVLYAMAFHYAYPGVAPSHPQGYLATVDNAEIFRGADAPYVLPRATARSLATQAMRFRHRFSFNAQHFVWKRDFVDSLELRGGLFQSPYPDYHAAILTMAEAASIVVVPAPEVIIGISPKSFGFFYQNRQFEAGQAMLGNDGGAAGLGEVPQAVRDTLAFPGSAHYRNWLIAALQAARSLARPLDQAVDLRRYRRLQIIEILSGGVSSTSGLARPAVLLRPHLQPVDARLLDRLRWLERLRPRIALQPDALLDRLSWMRGIYTRPEVTFHDIRVHRSISDAFRWVARNLPRRPAEIGLLPPAAPPLPVLEPIAIAPGRPSVAVVYLARSGDGEVGHFQSFIASYRAHAAGIAHDLVIIRKGLLGRPGSQAALATMLDGIAHRTVDVSDDGFDIQAYLKVAPWLRHDRVCFLNTFSQINAPDWLRHLDAALDRPGVGVAGATASYESLFTSLSLLVKVTWLTGAKAIPYSAKIARQYRDQIAEHAAAWLARRGGPLVQLQRAVSRPWLGRSDNTKALEAAYRKYWDQETQPAGAWSIVRQVKPFPNPHLRSNAFIIDRALMVELDFHLDNTKTASNLFECGTDGLPARLARRGLAPVLVGADGTAYDVAQWPESRTFRLGDQANLLVTDNQVRNFTAMSPWQRALHARMSWGDYLREPTQGLIDFGIKFPRGSLDIIPATVPDAAPTAAAVPAGPLVSVIIPFREGLAALRDTLGSVVRQAGGDWECVILDNASAEPVDAQVAGFADPRIRVERVAERLGLTASWNRAIDLARGTYVTVLSPGEALVPDHGARVADLADEFGQPDVIYSPYHRFIPPGVAPGALAGAVSTIQNAGFLTDRPIPFLLFPDATLQAATDALSLRRDFSTVLACFRFRRDFLDTLRRDGAVFHSARPDHYLATVALALSHKFIVTPQPLVVLGPGDGIVAADKDGFDAASPYLARLLPGAGGDAAGILAMVEAAERLGARAPADADAERYRKRQMFAAVIAGGGLRWMLRPMGAAIWPLLSLREKSWALRTGVIAWLVRTGRLERARLEAILQALTVEDRLNPVETHRVIGAYAELPAFLDALAAGRYPPVG
ncbi:glycosyltransferase family 2 protein [Plastoroseomonas arctica]|uniref:Glycosyltransferase n=1 Tax=Plastoroseomonas arctica TaxID=1509237 RepID=A0AAF1KJQ1_9PROT|nr:glycosyltransferase family 2 protein [Plastoroseomonas arctica]MBR0655590.1 glycosyltransferase [Plastoroseomonas arctica]